MKKYILLLAALVLTSAAKLYANNIHDINISVVLHKDGSASITERWEVDADEGTEWYLVRNNLGDIVISEFKVSDNGVALSDDGRWDIDRSRSQKKGKYGINPTSEGVELCWGIGDYGEHVYVASYKMSNVVKSLTDYDMLHLQLVSPGLSSRPEHVKVAIQAEAQQLDTTNTRAWGFGYIGSVDFGENAIIFESSERFKSNSSVIALLRFEKGLFESSSIQDRSFNEVAAIASEGAEFREEDDTSFGSILAMMLLFIVAPIAFIIIVAKWSKVNTRKKILGVSKLQDLGWGREVPFEGDLIKSEYVLKRLSESKQSNALASALILRMIYKGAINVIKDGDKKIELAFNDANAKDLGPSSERLYDMMKRASGGDQILQSREFSRWSEKHSSELHSWVKSYQSTGGSLMRSEGYMQGKNFTDSGKNEAVKLMSFRNFLKDFTMLDIREADEAVVWKEYLVFASLFGIADKVAEQLKDINPKTFEEAFGEDYTTMRRVIILNNNLSSSITNASVSHQINTSSKGASGGFGGGASFGGGGGFSGGGFGGGAR